MVVVLVTVIIGVGLVILLVRYQKCIKMNPVQKYVYVFCVKEAITKYMLTSWPQKYQCGVIWVYYWGPDKNAKSTFYMPIRVQMLILLVSKLRYKLKTFLALSYNTNVGFFLSYGSWVVYKVQATHDLKNILCGLIIITCLFQQPVSMFHVPSSQLS